MKINPRIILIVPMLLACSLLSKITPADRAAAYQREAQSARLNCKAYKFDRAAGLTLNVPEMNEVCK